MRIRIESKRIEVPCTLFKANNITQTMKNNSISKKKRKKKKVD